MTEHEFMTVAEVAETFRVSPMTVYRWLDDPATPLKFVRINRTIRITRESVMGAKERP